MKTLVLPQPVISAHHCRFFCGETGEPCIVDTSSSNGTFVNGQRLSSGQPQVLQPGDFICLVPSTVSTRLLRAPLRSEVDSMSEGERTQYVGYFRCTPAEESSSAPPKTRVTIAPFSPRTHARHATKHEHPPRKGA